MNRILGALSLICLGSLFQRIQAADPLDSWTSRTVLPAGVALYGTAWGTDRFVVVGDGGLIATSTDGSTWTHRTSGTTNTLNRVNYINNQFVATGENGTLLMSHDGVSWTHPDSQSTASLQGAAFGNNTYVVVGELSYSAIVLTSRDGITWTPGTLNLPGLGLTGDTGFRGIAFGNNRFAAVGYNNTDGMPDPIAQGMILTSTDGVTWIQTALDLGPYLSIIFANNQFAAVGEWQTTLPNGIVALSSDGSHWTRFVSPGNESLWGIAYGSGTYCVVGEPGILTSVNGAKLLKRRSGPANGTLWDVAYGNNTFVTVGDAGTILQSATLTVIAPTPPQLSAVAGPSAGELQLTLKSASPGNYGIQSTTDLSIWQTLTNVFVNNSYTLTIQISPDPPARQFFRGVIR